MKTLLKLSLALLLSAATTPLLAGGKDDPLLSMVKVDQLERRNAAGHQPLVLEAQGWLGHDLKKLWLKTEIERTEGVSEEAELQLLYSRAIAPYWNIQAGARTDFLPHPQRHWAVIGLQGLAPYFFETDIALFIGESGRTGLRLEFERELMLTQQWLLSPELKLNFHGHNDAELAIGSGLSDSELGLTLRYEINRKFAPYIGWRWLQKHDNTAAIARAAGETVRDQQFTVGLRFWF